MRLPSHPARLLRLAARAALALGLAAALPTWAQTAAPAPASAAATAETVRPAIGAALQSAQTLVQQGKAQEALAKLKEAEAVGGLTAYETMAVERTRAVAAQAAGNRALTISSTEAALATGKVAAGDELELVEALVGMSVRMEDHPRVLRWSARYFELGGTKAAVRAARLQSQLAVGDDKGALATLNEIASADEKAGQAVSEVTLRALVYVQGKLGDASADASLQKLAVTYPRPEYWDGLIRPAMRRAQGDERALLELYRLLRTAGTLTSTEPTLQMAELATRLGQPTEARAVLDEGYAKGVLGSGASAAEHQKLRDSVRKQAAADIADRAAAEAAARRAADGTALADLGWSIVAGQPRTGAAAGEVEHGLALIDQGIAKGGLRRPHEVRLHQGIAQIAAGRKEAARQTLAALASAAGADPLADAIRLWALWAGTGAPLPPYKP